jgi:hypothetical protein
MDDTQHLVVADSLADMPVIILKRKMGVRDEGRLGGGLPGGGWA